MFRRKRKPRVYWRPCPKCGDKKTITYRELYRFGKKYYVECPYCGFSAKNAFTLTGARKKWNKAHNIVSVTKDRKKG